MTEKWEKTQRDLVATKKREGAYKAAGEEYLSKWKGGVQYVSDSDPEEELEEQLSE